MKLYVLIFLLAGSVPAAFAQKAVATIELKVKNVDEGLITVTLPVHHTVFWGASRVDTLRSGKPHIISLDNTQTGYVHLDVFNRAIRLFVQSGNKLSVTIDEENEAQPLIITGDNREGQLLLSSNELVYAGNQITRYKTDTTAALLTQHVEEDKKVRQSVFKTLFDEKKIDKAFYDFAILTLDYYHAALISEVVFSKYAVTTLAPNHPQYKPVFAPEWGALWERIYKQYPVNDPAALRTFGYNDGFNTYAGNYIMGYLSWIQSKQGSPKPPQNWSVEIQQIIQRIQNNMQPEVAEYIEATILVTELGLEKNYKDLLSLADAFRKKFPQSRYLPYMEPLINKARAYLNRAGGEFTEDQKMVPDYAAINSFAELVNKFRGKPLFVEFWSSWCFTCKEEFKNGPDLHKFLQSKDITHLFISVDHQVALQEWKEMIKYYDLKGYHVRANPSLQKSISNIFWNGKGTPLPLYVIIDASGNIVEFDALRPSEKKNLYRQIESKLR